MIRQFPDRTKNMSASGLKQRPKSGPIDSTGTPSSVPTGFNEAVLYNLPTDLGQAVAGINGWVVIEDLLIKSLELPGTNMVF